MSGVPGVGRTVKSAEPIRRCTLSMTRSETPTLVTVSVRSTGPLQTAPKSRSSSSSTAMTGPVGMVNLKTPRP